MNLKRIFALLALALFCLSFSIPAQASPAPQTSPSAPPADPVPQAAGDDGDVKILAQIGGNGTAVAIQGDYAYLAKGVKLAVIDISESAAPRALGQALLANEVTHIAVSGPYAYVATSSITNAGQKMSLYVIDISNPASPQVVGSLALEKGISGLAASDGYVYLSEKDVWLNGQTSSGGVRVVDVRDPNAPRLAGFYEMPIYNAVMVVDGSKLYLTENTLGSVENRDGGLFIFDITNPASPALLSTFQEAKNPQWMEVSGGSVYVVDRPQRSSIDDPFVINLWIIDAAQPSTPVELGHVALPLATMPEGALIGPEISGIAIVGGWVYIGDKTEISNTITQTLHIVDVRDPRHPQALQPLPLPDDLPLIKGLAAEGSRLALCSLSGLHIFDLSAPAAPSMVSSYLEPSYVTNVAVSGSHAYLLGSHSLNVLDVTQPDHPSMVGYLNSKEAMHGVAASGTTVYLAGEGFQVIDASDPRRPQRIAFLPPEPVWYSQVTLGGHYAYVTVNDFRPIYPDHPEGSGLRIFDVADPAAPALVGSLDWAANCDVGSPVFAGGYVYVSVCGKLVIVDVSNPQAPVTVNTLENLGGSLALSSGYLLAAIQPEQPCPPDCEFEPLPTVVLDLSSPESPVEVSRFDAHGAMGVSGRYVYETTQFIDVWDLADPAHPARVGYQLPPYVASMNVSIGALAVSGGNAYVTTGAAGLYILRYASPAGGRVTDFNGQPAVNVQVEAGSELTATTAANGEYDFARLAWDHYTLAPELPGYAFWPPQRDLALHGAADGLSFTLLAGPVSGAVEPEAAASLTYTDTQGLPTRLDIPAGAAPVSATLAMTPTLASFRGGWQFTGHAFSLGASPAFEPGAPLRVTIAYSDLDVWSAGDESTLSLVRWTGDGWEDASLACQPASAYTRDPAANTLSAPICRMGLYALYYAAASQLYLPVQTTP